MEPEEPIHRHLAELFARTHPDCVLDVGANVGQYGALLREHGYTGWIVSFEPVPGAFEELARRAAADGRWRAVQLALGSRRERRRIAVAQVSQLSSFRPFSPYAAAELPGASEVLAELEVEVRPLHEVWRQLLAGVPHERPFLKLDTQGWDLEVLDGAGALRRRLVALQLEAALMPVYEHAPTLAHTLARVSELGFGLTGVFPVNRDSLFRLIEVDCVFINPSLTEPKETWAILTERFRREVSRVVPAGASFVLIDDATLGIDRLGGRRAIPLPERDGEYGGAPEDGAQALAELARQVERGVRYVAIAWPSFWWLEEYPELARQLRSRWRRVAASDAALVFELDPHGGADGRQS